MSDLIRRKDAIEVVCELVPIRNDAVEIADAIRAIPSAEPSVGYVGVDDDYLVSVKEVLNITAETGALETQRRVKELPRRDRAQGEWIPCSERLPEEREWIGTKKFGTTISDEVLVTFESRGERFVRPIHFQNGELGGMDKHTMDAVHGEWKAVAWMPLPKPYGEREGE